MIIKDITYRRHKNIVELSARVGKAQNQLGTVFFRVPTKYASFVFRDASPFLAGILWPAAKDGSSIMVDGTLSEKLSTNVAEYIKRIDTWGLGIKKVDVYTKRTRFDVHQAHASAVFFSLGVDSFYSLLKLVRSHKLTHLIVIKGFDIKVGDHNRFKKVLMQVESLAKLYDLEVIAVSTNIRIFTETWIEWDYAHGGVLAAVALLLRKGIGKVFIPGTDRLVSRNEEMPNGTHPAIDHLWSTEKLSVIHHGSETSRINKVLWLLKNAPEAFTFLRVCWRNVLGKMNCSQCEKCIRTMIDIKIAKGQQLAVTFDWQTDLMRIQKFHMPLMKFFYEDSLSKAKRQKEFPELVEALQRALDNIKHPPLTLKLRKSVKNLDQKYNKQRLFWFLARQNLV